MMGDRKRSSLDSASSLSRSHSPREQPAWLGMGAPLDAASPVRQDCHRYAALLLWPPPLSTLSNQPPYEQSSSARSPLATSESRRKKKHGTGTAPWTDMKCRAVIGRPRNSKLARRTLRASRLTTPLSRSAMPPPPSSVGRRSLDLVASVHARSRLHILSVSRCYVCTLPSLLSTRAKLPTERKHITKRRNRNQPEFPKYT